MKSALVEAAHSVAASKNYLGAMYRRIVARQGKNEQQKYHDVVTL